MVTSTNLNLSKRSREEGVPNQRRNVAIKTGEGKRISNPFAETPPSSKFSSGDIDVSEDYNRHQTASPSFQQEDNNHSIDDNQSELLKTAFRKSQLSSDANQASENSEMVSVRDVFRPLTARELVHNSFSKILFKKQYKGPISFEECAEKLTDNYCKANDLDTEKVRERYSDNSQSDAYIKQAFKNMDTVAEKEIFRTFSLNNQKILSEGKYYSTYDINI